jgi:hypothetical protein
MQKAKRRTEKPSEASRCDYCGAEASAAQLGRVSLPTPVALAAYMIWPRQLRGVADHDFSDRSWYCPDCRRRVQLRRVFAYVMIVAVPLVLARIVMPWVIYFVLPVQS